MTTREAGRAGKTVATATLIEAVRADGIEWEDHRGRVVMLAEDHDALRAACAAVLDEVTTTLDAHCVDLDNCAPTFRDYGMASVAQETLKATAEIRAVLDNARALREKLR